MNLETYLINNQRKFVGYNLYLSNNSGNTRKDAIESGKSERDFGRLLVIYSLGIRSDVGRSMLMKSI